MENLLTSKKFKNFWIMKKIHILQFTLKNQK